MAKFSITRATGHDILTPDKFLINGVGYNAVQREFLKGSAQDQLNAPFESGVESEPTKSFTSGGAKAVDPHQKLGLLGKPVLSSIELLPGKYFDLEGKEVNYDGIRIDSAIAVVNQQKNIVRTEIVGRQGSIKEYINAGDFVVTIQGILIGETVGGEYSEEAANNKSVNMTNRNIGNKYPELDVNRFISLMKVEEALKIDSEYLNRFGSYSWVVDSYDLPQPKGTTNVQLFTVRLISDTPIELQ